MYKTALKRLRESKERAERQAELDFLHALEIEGFKELEKRKRELNFELAKNPTRKLEKEHLAITNKQSELLKKHRLSMTPIYSCTNCSDTGRTEGKMCKCLKNEMNELLREKFGLTKEARVSFQDSDFSLFGELGDYYEKLFCKMQNEFCAKFPDTNIHNFVFSGSMGSGKTFLATCIANELNERGFDVFFSTAFGLGNMFLKIHTSSIDEKADNLSILLESDLLIIDDLGTESIYKNVTIEYLNSIINERLVNQKHTIITTNLTQQELLTRYGERIFSRLNNKANSRWLVFDGDDLRLNKKG